MRLKIKKLYTCASLLAFLLMTGCYAEAKTSLPNEIPATRQIKVKITKEKLNTSIDSLLIKDLESKIKLNKTIFDEKYNDSFNVDIIDLKRDETKNTAEQTNTNEKKPESYNNANKQTGNPYIHDVSFGQLRDDSRVKENDESYKNVILNNSSLINASNRQYISKVNSLIASGKISQAESMLDKTVSNIRGNSWSLSEVAGIYDSIGRKSKAENCYEKAVKANPNRIEILYSYALSLYKNNKLAKAEAYLQEVIRLNPEFTLAYYNLGNIYFKNQNYNMALKSFSKATQINPLCSDAYFNIAIILETLNHKNLALKYYLKCSKLEPKDTLVQEAVKRLSKS